MVGLVEIAVDGGLEVDDGAEHAALQSALGERGEEGFDGVEPGARGRGEVEGEARVAGEPGQHVSPSQAPTAPGLPSGEAAYYGGHTQKDARCRHGCRHDGPPVHGRQVRDRLLHRQEWRGIGFGAAASIITLLLWIYYSSLILLFGAEFTKAYAKVGAIGQRSLRGEEHQT